MRHRHSCAPRTGLRATSTPWRAPPGIHPPWPPAWRRAAPCGPVAGVCRPGRRRRVCVRCLRRAARHAISPRCGVVAHADHRAPHRADAPKPLHAATRERGTHAHAHSPLSHSSAAGGGGDTRLRIKSNGWGGWVRRAAWANRSARRASGGRSGGGGRRATGAAGRPRRRAAGDPRSPAQAASPAPARSGPRRALARCAPTRRRASSLHDLTCTRNRLATAAVPPHAAAACRLAGVASFDSVLIVGRAECGGAARIGGVLSVRGRGRAAVCGGGAMRGAPHCPAWSPTRPTPTSSVWAPSAPSPRAACATCSPFAARAARSRAAPTALTTGAACRRRGRTGLPCVRYAPKRFGCRRARRRATRPRSRSRLTSTSGPRCEAGGVLWSCAGAP